MPDGVPRDRPVDPSPSPVSPPFAETVVPQLGEQPVIAISTGDNPGGRSIYNAPFVLDQITDFYRRLDDLPPAIERIRVHPDELAEFLSRFLRGEQSALGVTNPLGSLMSIPIVTDPDVPLNVVRVRRDGRDTDYSLRTMAWMWPKGYEQPETGHLVSRNPDVYRAGKLRRIPWWRRWRIRR